MTTDFRALCVELIASWDADGCDWKPQHQARWETTVARARAALADGPAVPDGREPASVTGQPRPVPVSERLPGPEDCNAEGRCWWWYPEVPGKTYGYWAHEDDAVPERAFNEQPLHWLPATALPLPGQEVR